MENTVAQKWNLDSLYPGGSQSTELKQLIAKIKNESSKAKTLLTILKGKELDLMQLMAMLNHFQDALDAWEELDDFIYCLYAENTSDQEAVVLMEESDVLKSEMDSIALDLEQLLAGIPEEAWKDFILLEEVQPIAFYLAEKRKAAQDRLPVELERLINVLSVNGIKGWSQLHEQLISKLKIPMLSEGEEKEFSIGQAMNVAVYDSERSRRKLAADAIHNSCKAQSEEFAAIFNRIAGFRLDIYEQRGWENPLKEALEQNRISEETINAMLASIDENKELYQAYYERKLALESCEETSWIDLESPRYTSSESLEFSDAKTIILSQFSRFSDKMGQFATRAFEEGWIETENRPNKAEGGFCASMPLAKESRIFLTFRETYQDIVTLAHELGHAYHNFILHEEPVFAQQVGTCLAESASTFTENLVLDAVIQETTNDLEKLAMLEVKIRDGLKYVVTVPNMFRFEQEFYSQRKNGSLTVEKINELITRTENGFYEGMVKDLSTYKWMYISHFYDADKPFFNIPYTIGYLFSNGIYAQAQENPGNFQERYDELLGNSGKMTVEQLASTYLDADITKSDFWSTSQQSLKEAIVEYLKMTESHLVKG